MLPKDVDAATKKVHEAITGLDLTDVMAIATSMIAISIAELADDDIDTALRLVDATRKEIRRSVEKKLARSRQ